MIGKHSGRKILEKVLNENKIKFNDVELVKLLSEVKKKSSEIRNAVSEIEVLNIFNRIKQINKII